MNLTYVNIKDSWENYLDSELYGISDQYVDYSWLITGSLSQVNMTTGWLILQKLTFSTYSKALDAWGISLYQIALVSSEFQLQWLISKSDEWIS